MKLSTLAQGKDNNFNLIRVVAALAVLVTHSFSLATGNGDTEPLQEMLGMSIGAVAVDVFFITSGFLVTASLISRRSAVDFVWARVLRILPALLVMLVLTVFALGPIFTSLDLSSYFSDPKTYGYLAKCLTLIGGVAYELPGVFEGNPYKRAVNGSLWTMPHEVRMYAVLALMWIGLRLIPKVRLRAFQVATVMLALAAGAYILAAHFHTSSEDHFGRLFFMFFTGAAIYVLRERIAIYHSLFWVFLSALFVATSNQELFFFVYTLTIAYLLFFIAYIPSGHIRKYNRFGDYSYGIYIYAFPVQQSIAALIPGVSATQMIVLSSVITIPLAIASWHFLERRVLGLKERSIDHTRRMLSFGRTLTPWCASRDKRT